MPNNLNMKRLKRPKPVQMEDGVGDNTDTASSCVSDTTATAVEELADDRKAGSHSSDVQQKDTHHGITENELPPLDLSQPFFEEPTIAVRPASRSSSYHGDISPRAAPRQARRTYRPPASDVVPRRHSPTSPKSGRHSLGPFHSPPRPGPTGRILPPQRSFSASANPGNFMSSAFSPVMPPPMSPFFQEPQSDSNVPLSGYGLLSTQLGRGDSGTSVPPLYRRFSSLQHRILLGIQDELTVLEEQLRRCDVAESRQRQYYEGDAPASRRRDYMNPDHLSHQRHQILGAIENKLKEYRKLMARRSCSSSQRPFIANLDLGNQLQVWQDTTGFKDAEANEIDQYQAFMARTRLIVRPETEFLSREDDLMALDRPREVDGDSTRSETPTSSMIPRRRSRSQSPSPKPTTTRTSSKQDSTKEQRRDASRRQQDTADLKPILLGLGAAIIMPTLTFPLVPSFSGRIAVVFIAGISVLMILQSQSYNFGSNGSMSDALLLTAVYAVVMALVAATTH